jgi:hypothetical protein
VLLWPGFARELRITPSTWFGQLPALLLFAKGKEAGRLPQVDEVGVSQAALTRRAPSQVRAEWLRARVCLCGRGCVARWAGGLDALMAGPQASASSGHPPMLAAPPQTHTPPHAPTHNTLTGTGHQAAAPGQVRGQQRGSSSTSRHRRKLMMRWLQQSLDVLCCAGVNLGGSHHNGLRMMLRGLRQLRLAMTACAVHALRAHVT